MSMSLDGFVTARDDSREHPLGIDGQRLHRWVFEALLRAEPPPGESSVLTGAVPYVDYQLGDTIAVAGHGGVAQPAVGPRVERASWQLPHPVLVREAEGLVEVAAIRHRADAYPT